MSILIVGGCSITFGTGNANGIDNRENIERSYSKHIADHLGCRLKNVAVAGASNDVIFHSVMQQIFTCRDVHSVVVAWTNLERISWTNNNRRWNFVPVWAGTYYSNGQATLAATSRQGMVEFAADQKVFLPQLSDLHKFFTLNYFSDRKDLENKLMNYSQALNAVCVSKNIKLVELAALHNNLGTAYLFDPKGSWRGERRHPNADEHKLIAQEIIARFY